MRRAPPGIPIFPWTSGSPVLWRGAHPNAYRQRRLVSKAHGVGVLRVAVAEGDWGAATRRSSARCKSRPDASRSDIPKGASLGLGSPMGCRQRKPLGRSQTEGRGRHGVCRNTIHPKRRLACGTLSGAVVSRARRRRVADLRGGTGLSGGEPALPAAARREGRPERGGRVRRALEEVRRRSRQRPDPSPERAQTRGLRGRCPLGEGVGAHGVAPRGTPSPPKAIL